VQLELFEGEHVPLLRARAALEQGDLHRAHEWLAEAASRAMAPRVRGPLSLLERLLPDRGGPTASPERVQAIFEEALAGGALRSSGIDWSRLYAAHVAAALHGSPERRFRGWWQLHFELAAGRPRAALASAERLAAAAARRDMVGSPWLEAARAAFAAGSLEHARRWTLVACLGSIEPLDPAPPRLEPAGRIELDALGSLLPLLPDAILELWTEAFVLGLDEPRCGWVPSLGVLCGALPIADVRSEAVSRLTGFDLEHPAAAGEPPPRAFLRALVAARDARVREPGRCSALELEARSAMKRACPALFERYMETVGLYG
jgi:hypothetical protein